MLQFPNIDPVAFQIGPLQIRWYGLMYILGFTGGYFLVLWVAKRRSLELSKEGLLDLIGFVALGVILGGRLGYVVFYNLPYYIQNPLEIFAVWKGGMSFHGGLLGALLMGWWYCRQNGLSFYSLADLCAVAAPIGLGLGRIGNFINGELYGRPTDVPWGMVFPGGGPLPRHPSQLYEAFLEGFLLLAVLLWMSRHVRTSGILFWTFVGGYGMARFFVEFFREPDPQLGTVIGFMTMGQILSSVMILLAALFLVLRLVKREGY